MQVRNKRLLSITCALNKNIYSVLYTLKYTTFEVEKLFPSFWSVSGYTSFSPYTVTNNTLIPVPIAGIATEFPFN